MYSRRFKSARAWVPVQVWVTHLTWLRCPTAWAWYPRTSCPVPPSSSLEARPSQWTPALPPTRNFCVPTSWRWQNPLKVLSLLQKNKSIETFWNIKSDCFIPPECLQNNLWVFVFTLPTEIKGLKYFFSCHRSYHQMNTIKGKFFAAFKLWIKFRFGISDKHLCIL